MPRQADDLSSFLDAVADPPDPAPAQPALAPPPAPVPAVRDAPVATRMPDEPTAVRRVSGSARQAVLEAGWRAKDNPRGWQQTGWRAPVDLDRRLKARVARDNVTVPGFEQVHSNSYLSVALESVPGDPVKAAEMGMAFRRANRGPTRMANGSGKLVESHVAAKMGIIVKLLPDIESTAKVWEIAAAAVTDLLDQLDAEDAAAAG